MLTKEDAKNVDWVNIDLTECLEGNAMDAFYTIKIYNKLMEELSLKKVDHIMFKLISPALEVFRDIEYEGILIDTDKLKELKEAILFKLGILRSKLYSVEGMFDGCSVESTKDLVKLIFSLEKNKDGEWTLVENTGFGLYPFQKTDKGQPQTNEETLVLIKEMVDKEYIRRGLNEKQG